MKILFAGDENPYSAYALNEVIRLATNTWADVTLLAVAPGEPLPNPARTIPWPRPYTGTGRTFWPAPGARAHPMPWGRRGLSGFP